VNFEFKLAMTLTLLAAILPIVAMASSPPKGGDLVAPLTSQAAWTRLPQAIKGSGLSLPSWARMLSASLPKTTAALLELDLAHRTKSPLEPKLRAAMRWVAAHANHCKYGEAYAAFDARRAGLADGAIEALRNGDQSQWSLTERAALEFARKMTIESTKVTDLEFTFLAQSFGAKNAAAMVLLMAYANFQDRLLICLNAPVEEGGPMLPVDVAFKPEVLSERKNPAAPPVIPPLPKPTGTDLVDDDSEWASLTYDALQSKLENQRSRSTRLPVPSWDELKARGVNMKGTRVVWSLVVFGYVPELAAPWEAVMWINGEENGRRFDRVFGLSLFWIVTRSIDCPYCMGHCEMNWEVIGMTPSQIAERSRALASDDWSCFPPAEQRALAFARKLTRSPGEVTTDDVRCLANDFSTDPALSILMYACRCNYMVRISNGFQLTLERDNVFYDYYGIKPRQPSGAPETANAKPN
jgi:alkylhydroperoxidase family enzyme